MNSSWSNHALIGFGAMVVALLLRSCVHVTKEAQSWRPVFQLPEHLSAGDRLDEAVFEQQPFTADFKVVPAGAAVPGTRAWLWWNELGLWFAFAVKDEQLVAAPPTADEHAVDAQDRVEVFLWPEGSRRYFCLEIAPDGAVHDYAARVYRRFDDAWAAVGAESASRRTDDGYNVEGFVPAAALRRMGVKAWHAGTRFRLGLFRADFRPGAPDVPRWLTWVDPELPQADFHVPGAFAPVVLRP